MEKKTQTESFNYHDKITGTKKKKKRARKFWRDHSSTIDRNSHVYHLLGNKYVLTFRYIISLNPYKTPDRQVLLTEMQRWKIQDVEK